MSLVTKISLSFVADESSAIDLGSRVYNMKKSKLITLLDGTGAGQASKLYADSFSVTQSVNTDLDLSGALAGAFGTVVFTAIKGLEIIAGDSNPGALTVFGGTNPFLAGLTGTTPAMTVAAGNPILMTKIDASGWAVTNASNDNLRITTPATAGTYTFDVILVGI